MTSRASRAHCSARYDHRRQSFRVARPNGTARYSGPGQGRAARWRAKIRLADGASDDIPVTTRLCFDARATSRRACLVISKAIPTRSGACCSTSTLDVRRAPPVNHHPKWKTSTLPLGRRRRRFAGQVGAVAVSRSTELALRSRWATKISDRFAPGTKKRPIPGDFGDRETWQVPGHAAARWLRTGARRQREVRSSSWYALRSRHRALGFDRAAVIWCCAWPGRVAAEQHQCFRRGGYGVCPFLPHWRRVARSVAELRRFRRP